MAVAARMILPDMGKLLSKMKMKGESAEESTKEDTENILQREYKAIGTKTLL